MIYTNVGFRLRGGGSQSVFILNFHGLGEPLGSHSRNDEHYWTDPHLFAAILEAVHDRPDVLITFDDSYESDFTIALPMLEAAKISARFFVVANRIGQTGFLSSEQIRSLCSAGMIIGSHGMHHRRWPGLSSRELHEEVVEARDRIEQVTGLRIAEAACPFGGYNRRVLHCLRTSGYDRVYTSDGGPAAAKSWIQPRNTLVRGDDLQKVVGIVTESPSGPKAALRQLKLLLKQLR